MKTLALGLAGLLTILPTTLLAAGPSSPFLGEDGLSFANGSQARARATVDSIPAEQRAAFAHFRERLGSTWRADFDDRNGVPHQLWGGSVVASGVITSPELAEREARAILNEHLAFLAPEAKASDFVLASNDLSNGLRTVAFIQSYQGLEVEGGQLSFRFKKDRLAMIVSEVLPIRGLQVPSTIVARAQATEQAQAWLLAELGQAGTPRDFRGPLVLAETPEGPRAVVVATLRTARPIGQFDVYLDAASGRPLARRQTLKFADGTIAVDAPVRYPAAGRIEHVGDGLSVGLNGVPTVADLAGLVSWTGNSTATAVLRPEGPLVKVINAAGTATTTTIQLAPGGRYVWSARDDELIDAQLITFVASQDVKHYSKTIAPRMTWLDTDQLEANVNLDDICNAFSDGNTINFYKSGGGCENFGRITDVVYHEFGHAFHFHAILRGAGSFDSSLSEGAADFLAASMTGDSGTARGVLYDDRPLRDIDPPGREARWPDNISRDPHATGLIFAGAMWDLRKALIEQMGEAQGIAYVNQLYLGALQRSRDIPSSYREVLVSDDDDGNLDNGTPNQCLINAVFAPHGLVDPAVAGSGVKAPAMAGFQLEVPVERQNTCPGTEVRSMVVTWEVRGLAGSGGRLELAPGSSGSWVASIPSQPAGTVIRYKLEVTLGSGDRTIYPYNPADPMYEAYIGEVTPIYCTGFESDPLLEGWSHGSIAGNDDWEFGAPAGIGGSGDPFSAHSGDNVMGNDLGLGAQADGRYDRLTEIILTSQRIDTSAFSTVRLQYWRWLTVEDGLGDQATITANDVPVWSNYASTMTSTVHHLDKEWRFQDVDLSAAAAGGSVELGFGLTTNDRRRYGGWNIDDVCVVGVNLACGNGVLEVGESCDDGNLADGDGCESNCLVSPAPECGNGLLETGEACDDGNLADGDGCESSCTPTPVVVARCGDGNVDPGEACDDGVLDGVRCQAGCVLPTVDPALTQLEDSGGCGCSTHRQSGPGLLPLGLLALFGLARRRR